MNPLARKLLAEFLGTAALLATVVGSGIMGVRLSAGNDAVALLANAAATATALYALIAVLGPISGAHFNPLATAAMRLQGRIGTREALAYVAVQFVAAIAGVLLAHAMFELPLWQPGTQPRSGAAQWLSEAVASAGLVLTILLGLRHRPAAVPALVAAYVFAGYWFTASTCFANPAVTMARALTQTFAGIRPQDVAGFVAAQCVGLGVGLALARALLPAQSATDAVVQADTRLDDPAASRSR
ncbi:aquaporin [Lysobacter sp. BMK333-48F3]|uniref:aquaporin n=1 Tax=Lysobacter sp. BMK333-48F3 TaxID=2867962 RepID=UPI001C8CEC2B|nr:aquaporin [Lysobacter sp. BMK333-48F3]